MALCWSYTGCCLIAPYSRVMENLALRVPVLEAKVVAAASRTASCGGEVEIIFAKVRF